ncbi:MAG: hypothetical protein AAF560_11325, partial [Acidobacteriota bacterium]
MSDSASPRSETDTAETNTAETNTVELETAEPAKTVRRLRPRAASSLFAAGEPMVWLTGGALVVCAAMVAGLLALVFWKGAVTFWHMQVVRVETPVLNSGSSQVFMGEVTRADTYQPEQGVLDALDPAIAKQADSLLAERAGEAGRRLFRTGNFRLTQNHFRWVSDYEIAAESRPEWVLVIERLEWGRFYGFPEAFLELTPVTDASQAREVASGLTAGPGQEIQLLDRRFENGAERDLLVDMSELDSVQNLQAVAVVSSGPEAAWQQLEIYHDRVQERWHERRDLEKYDTGRVSHEQEKARLAVREAELELERAAERQGRDSNAHA